MSLTDCLSERIWTDPCLLLCSNCSVPLAVSASINERIREFFPLTALTSGTYKLVEGCRRFEISLNSFLHIIFSPQRYVYGYLKGSTFPTLCFLSLHKPIFTQLVESGAGGGGSVSVSGGVVLAVCQPLVVIVPLNFGLGYSAVTAGQNLWTFNTLLAHRFGCAWLAQTWRKIVYSWSKSTFIITLTDSQS